MVKIVSRAELLARRGISDVQAARALSREQKRRVAISRRDEEELRTEARRITEREPEVFVVKEFETARRTGTGFFPVSGEFKTREAARAEIEKLRKARPSARFVVRKGVQAIISAPEITQTATERKAESRQRQFAKQVIRAVETVVGGKIISTREENILVKAGVPRKEVEELQAIIKERPTTKEEIVQSLLRRQGQKTTVDKGIVTGIKGGIKTVIDIRTGRTATVPVSAVVSTKFAPKELKKVTDIRREDVDRRFDSTDIIRPTNGVLPSRLGILEEEIQAQKRREAKFISGKGFERIESVAGVLTGAARIRDGRLRVIEKEARIFPARVAQSLVGDILGFPIAAGGALAVGAEKAIITAKALRTPEVSRAAIREELFVAAPRRTVEAFRALPLEEKIALGAFVAVSPLIGGGPLLRLARRGTVKTKAIQKLTPTERAKLERFEISARELKGVEVKPKKIKFQEVERLSPKAAKALEKVVLRNKRDIVIGGSVAQRTQIKRGARIPEDIDIFTSRNPKELIREIVTELQEAGVKRVSGVRGKQVTIEGKKAIEVKELELLRSNVKKVLLPFQPFSTALATTPRGVRVLKLGAQAKRKVIGGFGLEAERRRAKDIEDLPSILAALRASKRGSLTPSFTRARSRLLREIGLSPFVPLAALESGVRREIAPEEARAISSILRRREERRDRIIDRPSILPPPDIPSRLPPLTPTPTGAVSILPPPDIPSRLPPPTPIRPPAPPSILPPTEPPRVVEPTRRPRLGITRRERERRFITENAPSFDVVINKGLKRGGRSKIAERNLPPNKALRLIKQILDNNIEASGRLKPNRRQPKVADDLFRPVLRRKFRPPKKGTRFPSNTIIERRGRRLDTEGERRQISFFKKQKGGRRTAPILRIL